MEDLTGKQTEFREELWGGLVDHIRIDEKGASGSFAGCLFLVSFILNNKDERLL
jgi:hypothetical protein